MNLARIQVLLRASQGAGPQREAEEGAEHPLNPWRSAPCTPLHPWRPAQAPPLEAGPEHPPAPPEVGLPGSDIRIERKGRGLSRLTHGAGSVPGKWRPVRRGRSGPARPGRHRSSVAREESQSCRIQSELTQTSAGESAGRRRSCGRRRGAGREGGSWCTLRSRPGGSGHEGHSRGRSQPAGVRFAHPASRAGVRFGHLLSEPGARGCTPHVQGLREPLPAQGRLLQTRGDLGP